MIPALFGLAGSLTAGGLNYAGQASANKATRKMVREQMSFQEGSVKDQMAFSRAYVEYSLSACQARYDGCWVEPNTCL